MEDIGELLVEAAFAGYVFASAWLLGVLLIAIGFGGAIITGACPRERRGDPATASVLALILGIMLLVVAWLSASQ